MKRDMDLVRRLLFFLEEKPDPKLVDAKNIRLDGVGDLNIQYHLNLMYQAGFINGEAVKSSTSDRLIYVMPFDLTWDGHEFLESVRDPHVWQKAKAGASKAGTASIEFIWGIAKALTKKAIEDHTGLKLGD